MLNIIVCAFYITFGTLQVVLENFPWQELRVNFFQGRDVFRRLKTTVSNFSSNNLNVPLEPQKWSTWVRLLERKVKVWILSMFLEL
jgi:hypothetical protein